MPKILVIEDTKAMLNAWVKKFESQGFDVYTADCAEKAVKVAQENRPQIVVVDLPNKEGTQAIKKIREHKWGSRLPVLFLNSLQDPEVYMQYSVGPDVHLAYNWSLQE